MSGDALIVLAVAGVYLVICLGLGLASSGGKANTTAYVAGDRSLGLVVMYFITGATVFSAFAFLGLPGWAYSRGAAAFYVLGYGALGILPFYFMGPRAARLGRVRGYVTQAELIADRFGMPSLALLMAVVSVAAFVPYLALQIKGAGIVLAVVSQGAIPAPVGGAVVYAVVTVYVLTSGVLGVGWTNTFQGLLMMSLAWAFGVYLPTHLYGGVDDMFALITAERPELLTAPGLHGGEPWSWGEYSSAVFISIAGFTAWPHLFMKAFTAKSARVLKWTVVLYPTFQIFLLPLFLIGFAGVLFEPPPARPDAILPHLMMSLDLSPILVGLFCAGALAASMSSGDAMVHAAASIVVRDGYRVGLGGKVGPREEVLAIRILVVALMIASYAVAITYQGTLVVLLLTTYGAVVQFMPGLLAALFWRRANGLGVLVGMIVGSLVTALFIVLGDYRPFPVHAGVYGLAANVAILVLYSLTRPPPPGTDRFFADMQPPGPAAF